MWSRQGITRRLAIVVVACVLTGVNAPSAQETDALHAAADLLGVANVRTLEFTGWGATFSLGANFSPNDPWPRVTLRDYKATINYDTSSMRVEQLREMGTYMPLGDGVPFMGQQRQILFVRGTDAWNMPVPAPGAAQAPAVRPTPGTTGQPLDPVMDRRLALWATPYGFVKAALANQATQRPVRGGTEVAFTLDGKYKMVGIINAQHQVERVQTWIDYPLMGDVLVETVYRVYKSYDGVLFPASIVQSMGGFPTLDVTTISARTNVPADITVPENVRGAQPPPVRVDVQKVAEGVYFFTGGHNSMAIEMRDHIVIFDTPNSEARGLAVIAKAKELIPNKPVRYVINSHHHWDHSAGLRAAMEEGATIVIHESNRAFFEQVAKRPHTLAPDRLSKSRKTPKFLTFGADGLELTDGARTIAVYEISPNEHALDLAMVYLPNEKILAEADAYNSGAEPGELLSSVEVPKALALYDVILRRKLDVQTIVPFHGARTTTFENLAMSLGKIPSTHSK